MEEKKLDSNSIIGFVLIFAILLFMLWQNKPTEEELAAQKEAQKQEQLKTDQQSTAPLQVQKPAFVPTTDSTKLATIKSQLGAFGYSASVSGNTTPIVVENDVLKLTFNPLGGQLSEVKLKEYVDFNDKPIYLVKNNNALFNVSFSTVDNRSLNTQNLYFQPEVTKNGNNTVVSMKLKVSEAQYLEYRYELNKAYMLNFTIRSQGLSNVINSSQNIDMLWEQKAYRYDRSISYENRYTRLTYEAEGKVDKLGQGGSDDEVEDDVRWISFRQHFFSTLLINNAKFKKVAFTSEDLVKNEDIDTLFTKQYTAKTALALNGGEINENMKLYYGPTDYKLLKSYDEGIEKSVPFGWGIFGWINKYLFLPLFTFLSTFLPYGIAIIVMTVLIKLMMSFVQYNQYLSQMKMKILKPELDAIREKYKDNKMKQQQETMALQSKAGASPITGCLPALIQMPVFYALFMFFPVAFILRQKKFLWAEDLSSYDIVAQLPFKIPFYGDHVSLFPILAAVAIFFYMRMTTSQQTMTQPVQEGMPDMQQMMKYMIYFAPLMMLVFFNQYASGLSLYYFISNLISIGIMLVIKNFILDEDKIHAKIQEKKSKPKKTSKFQQRMQDMMAQAEQQRQMQEKMKKKK